MKFADHFSGHAASYAQFRPSYPRELFEYLASIAPGRERAWDCATGSGQAAVALAEFFRCVIATDASRRQIEYARAHGRVDYRVAPAEGSGLADESIDLITIAQALHWFDLPRFLAEVRRVLRPGGIVAAWAYTFLKIEPEIDRLVGDFYQSTTGPYWPPQRAIVDAEYRDIEFPFAEVWAPGFTMKLKWTLPELLGYLRTWSATQRYIAEFGTDPVTPLGDAIGAFWPDPNGARSVSWPLHLRVGRI